MYRSTGGSSGSSPSTCPKVDAANGSRPNASRSLHAALIPSGENGTRSRRCRRGSARTGRRDQKARARRAQDGPVLWRKLWIVRRIHGQRGPRESIPPVRAVDRIGEIRGALREFHPMAQGPDHDSQDPFRPRAEVRAALTDPDADDRTVSREHPAVAPCALRNGDCGHRDAKHHPHGGERDHRGRSEASDDEADQRSRPAEAQISHQRVCGRDGHRATGG